jgi:peptidyl-prolyl cis-trans isomerase SurA
MPHKSAKILMAAIIYIVASFSPQFLGGTAAAQSKTLEEIIAWVNNDIILKSEYEKRRVGLREELAAPAPNGAGLQGAQLEQEFNKQSKFLLQQLIDETLILQQAKDMGLTAENEVVKAMDRLRQQRKLDSIEALEKEIVASGYALEDFKQNIRLQYLTEEVRRREVYPKVTITTEEVRKYYDSHIKDFDRPAGYGIREITVLTQNRGPELIEAQRKKAEDALAELKKGEDFAKVVDKYSESDTAANGGDLGFQKKGELTPAIEALLEKLDKGQFTDVIPVQDGFMILKLDDKHPGGILPFELAQKEVTDTLWQQTVPSKTREYLTKLRTDGFIRIAEGYVDAGAPQKTEKTEKTVAKD